MKIISLLVLIALVTFGYVVARHTFHGVDLQTDYLNKLLEFAKMHSKVKGELNFSPDGKVFSNIVRSVAGKRGQCYN